MCVISSLLGNKKGSKVSEIEERERNEISEFLKTSIFGRVVVVCVMMMMMEVTD